VEHSSPAAILSAHYSPNLAKCQRSTAAAAPSLSISPRATALSGRHRGLVFETEFLARAPVADPLLQAQQTSDEVRVRQNVVATTPDISFLATPDEIRGDLLAAGFQIVLLHDTAAAVAATLAPFLKQLETEGLPPLTSHIVMGENEKEWRINVMRSQAEGRAFVDRGTGAQARLN
jgi:hypothetical protein